MSVQHRQCLPLIAVLLPLAAGADTISQITIAPIYSSAFAQACLTSSTGGFGCSGFAGGWDVDLNSPSAEASQGGAWGFAASLPGFGAPPAVPGQQGQGAYAVAEAPAADYLGSLAQAASWVSYTAQAPGYFDLTLRAAANGGGGNWLVEIVPYAGYANLLDDSGTDVQGYPFSGARGSTPGTAYYAEADGSYGTDCCYGGSSFVVQSTNDYSNTQGIGTVFPEATLSDTLTFFSPSTDFYLFVMAFAQGTPPCVQEPCVGDLPSFAFVDPFITPDAANPGDTLTSSALPNPNPGAPLFSSTDLQSLSPGDVQDLIQLGVLSGAPEPDSFSLGAIGIAATMVWKRLINSPRGARRGRLRARR